MTTAERLSKNSRQGFEVQKPACIGLESDLSRNVRWGCGHVYDETPVGIAVYVRNDPVNLVDPDGRRPSKRQYFIEVSIYQIYTYYDAYREDYVTEMGPAYPYVYARSYGIDDDRPNPFQGKVKKAKSTAINKLDHADEDCLKLFEHLEVSISALTGVLKDEGIQYQDGTRSQDKLWTVMGGEVAGTDSTTTVADLFRMGAPPYPSNRSVDGLSASNWTIYLRQSAVTWENIVHENIHQLGENYSDDNLLGRLWAGYSDKIDREGPSSQINKMIKEKCN
jgi:hypothetical protein